MRIAVLQPNLLGDAIVATPLLRQIRNALPQAHVSLVLGPALVADTGEWGTYAWTDLVLGAPGYRVGGGTDEVLKNVIAERVLGLPKDR